MIIIDKNVFSFSISESIECKHMRIISEEDAMRASTLKTSHLYCHAFIGVWVIKMNSSQMQNKRNWHNITVHHHHYHHRHLKMIN